MDLNEITKGLINYSKQKMDILDPAIETRGQERLSICKGCPLYVNGICSNTREAINVKTGKLTKGCGCICEIKVLSDSECPLSKW